ncbi:class I SAM-dependent methyltransferase, partial [bacterium]|nr:class I SAM-dependent methyltransferase [bacterium]
GRTMKKSKREGAGKAFWDKEYKKGEHLALSTEPSEDVVKFSRWLARESGGNGKLSRLGSGTNVNVLDVGCGNGRNLVYLSQEFGIHGFGFDISQEAIARAKKFGLGFSLEFSVRDMKEALPFPDESQDIVLDMMASHVLSEGERKKLLGEVVRVLKPDGYLFFKTFLLEEDRHAARLLKEHPGKEHGSYVHPKVGVEEHAFTVAEIEELLSRDFTIRKIIKSHKHLRRGKAWKRRSICIYAQKI